ncbi:MAG: chemotaxis protein CheA [Myxococcaceae bacterium]|nr:chemotaxis protein CheA [Myxococcaceae bacterium]
MSAAALQERLLSTFLEESREGLGRAEAALLRMGTGAGVDEIDDVFRAIHSLKGSAGSMGQPGVAQVAHALESHLDGLRRDRRQPDKGLLKVMLQAIDGLRALLDDVAAKRPVDLALAASLAQRVERVDAGGPPQPAGWVLRFTPPEDLLSRGLDPLRLARAVAELGPTRVRADLSRLPDFESWTGAVSMVSWEFFVDGSVGQKNLEDVFDWVDGGWSLERKAASDAAAPTASPVARAAAAAAPAAPETATIRIPIPRIDQLMNMVGELVITQAMLGELDDDGPIDAARAARLREGLSLLARNTHALQDGVMRLRSVPLSVVFGRLPRLVHDVAAQLKKEVQLAMTGETTELDKTVIERLGDPLTHLVRNCLDHGLEHPAERAAAGKTPSGMVSVSAWQKGGEVFVEVADDGRGLDYDKIRRKALERGLLPVGAAPSPEVLTRLIFEPGFSTAEAVTDLSGRGVGMDVVMSNVKQLGGDISVTSTPGQGTRFLLRLPVSLAIIDGQLVRVGGHTWVIPLLSILETVQPEASQLARMGAGQVMRLRDQLIPSVPLAPLLGMPAERPGSLMVVVEGDGTPVGLLVDELLGQQQVVVKSLETNYGSVRGVQGATILGDGSVSFILEVGGLTRAAGLSQEAA